MLHQTPAPFPASCETGQLASATDFPQLKIHIHIDKSGRMFGSTTAGSMGNALEEMLTALVKC